MQSMVDVSSNIWQAIHVLSDPFLIFILIGGVFLGIFMGALPGVTATMGIAVMIPVTFTMDSIPALLLLMSIYAGAIYGGSIPAIMLNTPGTAASAATTLDGYSLTRQGKGSEALEMAAFASFVGGLIGALALLFFAPFLSSLALKFGPPEVFLLTVAGLSIIISLSRTSIMKGAISGLLGVMIGTVGTDPIVGNLRFTFNKIELMDGIALVPLLIGLLAVSQLLLFAENPGEKSSTQKVKLQKGVFLGLSSIRKVFKTILRSSVMGTIIGLVPGAGGSIASFLAYNEAKRGSKNPDNFGKGDIEGVAAPEAANNGVTGGSLTTMFTLGIPGSEVTAILLGGLIMHGITPGPSLFKEQADVAYPLVVGFLVANIIMLLMAMAGKNLFAQVARIPNTYIVPIVIILSSVGAYSINIRTFDVGVMFIFGLIGYLMLKFGFSPVAMILGVILGPIAETKLIQTLTISKNNLLIFFERPVSIILILLILFSFLSPLIKKIKSGRSK